MKKIGDTISWLLMLTVLTVSFAGSGMVVAQEKVKLSYISNMWREVAVATQEKQLEEFKKTHPNIELEPTLYIPWGDYRMWLLKALASGTLPDVIQHGVEFLDEFAQHGTFLPLDKYITGDHYNRIVKIAWESAKVEETIYGLPHSIWLEPAFMYRTDIFKEEGIEPPQIGEAWTMEEALSVAKKLTKDLDGDGEIDRWGWVERGRAGWIFLKHFGWHIRTWDGNIIRKLPDGRWKSGMDLPGTRDTIRFFIDLHTKHKVAPKAAIGYGFEDWRSGFITGKIAMGSMGTWLGSILYRENPDVKWSAMNLPSGKIPITQIATFVMSISSQTEHPDEAWELAKWLTTQTVEDRIKIADIQGCVVVFKNVLERPEYQEEPMRAVFKPFFQGLATGEIENLRMWARHPNPQYADIMISVVAPTVHNIILGKMSFEEGIEYMEKEINKKLRYFG